MNDRRQKLWIAMILGSFLLVSCSGPTEKPAATAPAAPAADAKAEIKEPEAPSEVEETPKPQAAAKKAPAPVAKAAAPAPVPVPVAAAPAPASAATPAPASAAPLPVASAPVPVVVPAAPAAPPAPTTRDVTIPSGTVVSLRMIDPVDSKTDHVGQTFKASFDSAVIVDGLTVFPRGGDAFVKLTKVESAGKLSGTSEIQLQLERVFIGNKSYNVISNTFQSVGESQGKKAVKQTGIGAGVGAIIGAIAGGKKGAAIGAGVGGGAGATATAVQNSDQVRVESEAKLAFRLEQPLSVTVPLTGAAASSGRAVPLSPGK